MSNHVENDLYIYGPPADVQTLLEFVGMTRETPTFDFNVLIPYPERFVAMDKEHDEISQILNAKSDCDMAAIFAEWEQAQQAYQDKWGTVRDGFNSGGWEWRCENWGTKWNAYKVERRDYQIDISGKVRIILTFKTAWQPPSFRIFELLQQKFPAVSLTLEFYECGGCFCGGAQWLSEDDYEGDDIVPWKAGYRVNEWRSEYHGVRGG